MLHSLTLVLINKVKNNNKYVLTLNHELETDFSTKSQTPLVFIFLSGVPYGYFKYNISKMTPTGHHPSTFFLSSPEDMLIDFRDRGRQGNIHVKETQ